MVPKNLGGTGSASASVADGQGCTGRASKQTFEVLSGDQDLWVAYHRSLFQINRYFLNLTGEFEWHLIVLTNGCAGVFADVKCFIE